jgi:hypothetical protein
LLLGGRGGGGRGGGGRGGGGRGMFEYFFLFAMGFSILFL